MVKKTRVSPTRQYYVCRNERILRSAANGGIEAPSYGSERKESIAGPGRAEGLCRA